VNLGRLRPSAPNGHALLPEFPQTPRSHTRALPLIVWPIPADRAKHIAAYDRRAQALLTGSSKTIINAPVAALLTEHPAERPCGKRPVVELLPADTERVVETLVRSCGVAVN
jgi:hypothetical protein